MSENPDDVFDRFRGGRAKPSTNEVTLVCAAEVAEWDRAAWKRQGMHPIGLGIRWVPEPKGKAGVYIIGDGSGFVKIGRARNITARLATFHGGNPRGN